MDAREVALSILLDMEVNGTFSSAAITKALRQNQFEDKTDRSFVTRLAEGTTEYRITLDYIIDCFSKTEVKKCKPLIRCLLRMGTYQIMHMDGVPDSAACNETVRLAKKHGFSALSGFVNGVLRNIARNKTEISYPSEQEEPVRYLSVRYSMPEWLVSKILNDYPEQAAHILEGTFEERDTTIRVNTCRTSVEELRRMLEDKGICVSAGIYDDKALRIRGYDFIRRVPGYRQGLFTVQDESSMCAVRALGIRPGETVLDVCAAPGGKTTAAAEYLCRTGVVYAMDKTEDKTALIEENVERLGLENVKISVHDATRVMDDLGQETAFADVVIADLPCSGLGIMGRKNDIKYRMTEEQMRELSALQRQILSVAHQYVRPKGRLLYSTCTINPEENEKNAAWFLERHPEFCMEQERLFLPGADACDGFYYALFTRA